MSERLVTVGEVRGVYGVKGWVKLFSFTAPRENLLGFERFVDGRGEILELVEARVHGKGLIGRFAGCEDRDAAIALNGSVLSVPRGDLPATAPGEYYWDDLIGLVVTEKEAGRLGTVRYLIETGADDVMVIGDDGREDILVPFAWEQVVTGVDMDAREITVDWPAARDSDD